MNHQNQRENEDWLVLSDLSMGGFIIFLIIAVAFIARANQNQQGILNALKKFQSSKVEVDSTDKIGAIRFVTTKDELFALGSPELSDSFKVALNDFLPEYLDTILKYKHQIAEIRIEGHTDDVCSFKSELDCYQFNLELSAKRAANVVRHILDVIKKDTSDRARSDSVQTTLVRLFVASGQSYSQALDTKGKIIPESKNIPIRIDRKRSRRVDFRIILRAN